MKDNCENHVQYGQDPYPIMILKSERSEYHDYIRNMEYIKNHRISKYCTENEIRERYKFIDKAIEILEKEFRELGFYKYKEKK